MAGVDRNWNYNPGQINLLDGDLDSHIRSIANCDEDSIVYRYSRTRPDIVKKAHMEFLDYGANLIRTFTYRTTHTFMERSLNIKSDVGKTDLIEKAVFLAELAVNDLNERNHYWGPANVVGCCGDNAYLREHLNGQELFENHLHRIKTLIWSGVKILSFEEVYDLEEANMLLGLIRDFPNIKALITFDSRYFGPSNRDLFRDTVHKCYCTSADKILAIGIQGGTPEEARTLLDAVNESRSGHYLIPLVACTDNIFCEHSWEPVSESTVNTTQVWEMMGIKYVGGNRNVLLNNILWNRIVINGIDI